MESVFSLILDMSLTASYVIIAILLIRLLLRKAPKKYSYALWLVAAFRLICPVSIESAFSIFNLRFGKSGAALNDVPTYLPPTNNSPAQPAPNITPPDSAAIVLPDATPNIGTAPTVPIVPTEPAASVSLMGVLAIIWCIGIAALLIYSVYTYMKLKRQLSTAVLLQDNIRQASGIRSPFILGFIRPQIYVPYHLSEGETDYVLAHERFHLKRRDHIIKPLAFLILVLHWFNPLVWLAFYLMVRDMEMSCDEKVLSRDESIRKDYSSTLLSFAAGRAFPAPSPLSFGEGSVKSRIKNILNWKKPALWLTAAAIVICAAVIAVCGTNARTALPNKVSEAYANGEAVSSEAAEELVELINIHSKTSYHKAPAEVGTADSRVAINFEDGSSYYLHYWYCSGFSFNPAHFGEDDYYTILIRLDENGDPEKSWKMEYGFDKVFLDWLEKYSAGNLYPFGNEFTLSEAVFTRDNGVTLPFETAESIRLDSKRTLFAGSEPLGTFEHITITASNWDNYLTGASGTWLTYSAKELRRHNSHAWRIVSGDRYYYLLLQDDGTLYLAGGYYDAEGEYDSESDDSNIFCVYELAGEGSAIRWQYVQYEQPDYFPLRFDFEYSSIRFIATEGRIRSIDASGAPVSGIDIELTAEHSEIGWQPDIDANMSASLRHEGDRENGAPVSEIFFTAALPDGSTLSGTIIVSRRDQNERYIFEITLQSNSLSIKRNSDGGAVIYPASANTAPAADIYVPISCLYMAPHSSYYPWGGDSGCRYIIGSNSITVERMDGSHSEVIFFDSWNYSVLSPHSSEWTEKFIGTAPSFEGINKPLYLQISSEYFLLNLDGQLCIGEVHDGLVWDIYAIVPQAKLGSAVWEYRPELSSRSPWFEFEFDMEYESLQISSTQGDLSSDGSRVNGKQLGIPAGYSVRWSPLGRFQPAGGTQLQFEITLKDGRLVHGTIYISSEDNLYTAVLHANGLHLSNDEDYGHAVITLTDLAAQDYDISSLIADKLRANFELGGSLYLTPYFAGQGKQETLLLTHRDDISGFIRNCQLSPVEAPSTEPSDYWIEISGIVSGTKITVWHGSSDTLKLTTEEGTQYYRVIGKSLAETLLQVYSGKTFLPFTSDLDELLNTWQAEGFTTLSTAQLEQLNKNFVPNIVGEGNPLSNFFMCYYDRPEEINLAAFLQYNFVAVSEYTEEDFYALKQQYPDHGQLFASDTYEDAKQHRNPIHKYPRESVDEQLMRYAGITTAQLTANVDWENSGLVYLAEADAYFNFFSDMAAGAFTASSGEIVGNTVYLYNGFTTLTLRKSGDIWLIYSHTYDS